MIAARQAVTQAVCVTVVTAVGHGMTVTVYCAARARRGRRHDMPDSTPSPNPGVSGGSARGYDSVDALVGEGSD